MKNEYFVRPVAQSDLDGIFALSVLAGPGFTSLQPDRAFMNALILKSERSFKAPDASLSNLFLLVMEDTQSGKLVGCASVKTGIGDDSFMCADFERLDPDGLPARSIADCVALRLKRSLSGLTEVGSLFLHPQHRASGAGRFLARSRYMLMSTHPSLFSRPIVAQLRGWSDESGNSAFYDTIWAERLGQPYEATDAALARKGAGFVLERFDALKIDIDSLPEDVMSMIGIPHSTAAGALKLLLQEGFRISSLVDLSDGGPIVIAAPDDIRSVRDALVVKLTPGDITGSADIGMLVRRDFDDFRAYIGELSSDGAGNVACNNVAADFLRSRRPADLALCPGFRRSIAETTTKPSNQVEDTSAHV